MESAVDGAGAGVGVSGECGVIGMVMVIRAAVQIWAARLRHLMATASSNLFGEPAPSMYLYFVHGTLYRPTLYVGITSSKRPGLSSEVGSTTLLSTTYSPVYKI